MGLASTVISQRHNSIIEYLVTPHSVKDVAAEFNVSYYTARNDIMTLIDLDLVQPVAKMGDDGTRFFIAGGKRPMPVISVKSINKQLSVQDIGVLFGNNVSARQPSEEATRNVLQTCLILVYEAARAHSTGTPPSRETLNAIRSGLVQSKMALESQIFIADQLLAHSQLWNIDYLPRIAEDDNFDAEAIESAYSNLLDYLEKSGYNVRTRDRETTGEAGA